MRCSLLGCIAAALLLVGGSAAADEVETIEVRGEAAILDDDEAAARDKAIDDALRKAVESAVGTMISSETITENYQLISDRIYSRAKGYVRSYKIRDEREQDGVYIVDIRAKVAVGAVSKDVDGLATLLKRKKYPKVLVLVAEQNIGMNGPAYWWGKTGPVSMSMRTVENALMEKMAEKGFTFVDTEVLTGKKSVKMPVAKLSDKQAMRIADVTDAQIVIVGQAVAKDQGSLGDRFGDSNIKTRSARAVANVRVINTDNGRVIAVAQMDKGKGFGIDAKLAGNEALKDIGQDLAEELIDKIAKAWSQELAGANRVRMTVKGLQSFSHLRSFMKVLRNRVRSVQDVRKDRFSKGMAVLEIDLEGDTSALATELEAKDFDGQFKIEITDVTNNAIGVKLLP